MRGFADIVEVILNGDRELAILMYMERTEVSRKEAEIVIDTNLKQVEEHYGRKQPTGRTG